MPSPADLPGPSSESLVGRTPIHHWDLPTLQTDDVRAAAKWAWKCLVDLANVFCCYHCDPFCNKAGLPDGVRRDTEGLGDEARQRRHAQWLASQYALHKALAFLPPLLPSDKGCGACALARALAQFPKLVPFSPRHPVATQQRNGVDCYPEILSDPAERSIPCCIMETSVGDGHETEIHSAVREGALTELDLTELPPIPPGEFAQIRPDLDAGSKAARCLLGLTEGQPDVAGRAVSPGKPDGNFERHAHDGQPKETSGSRDAQGLDLPTLQLGICCAVCLRDLARVRIYYPQVLREEEAALLESGLLGHLHLCLSSPGFEKFGELPIAPATQSPLDMETTYVALLAVLILSHPKAAGHSGVPGDGLLRGVIAEARRTAPETVQSAMDRLVEVILFECRDPAPEGDPSYQDPRRALRLLGRYWGICRLLFIRQTDTFVGFQPHPLTPMIVNLYARMDVCFSRLMSLQGSSEAREVVHALKDILFSSEPADLSDAPEWTYGEIQKIDAFVEQARIAVGTGLFELTWAETMFLDWARQQIEEYDAHCSRALQQMLTGAGRASTQAAATARHAQAESDQTQASMTSGRAPAAAKEQQASAASVQRPAGSPLPQYVCDAWHQYEDALQRGRFSSKPTDRQVYDWVLIHLQPGPRMPKFDTWQRYVRYARQQSGLQKNRPRGRRFGGSTVRREAIE